MVAALRDQGLDVVTVVDAGLQGAEDSEVVALSVETKRAVLTLDSDFGTLAIRLGAPYFGIVYVRPGHKAPSFTLETLRAVATSASDVTRLCCMARPEAGSVLRSGALRRRSLRIRASRSLSSG